MSDEALINVAGAVLRDDQGRYLMVQEKRPDIHGLWNIPAGHQDKGETLQEAAVRETYEEVGLHVDLLSDKPVFSGPTASKRHIFHAFPAKVSSGSIVIPEDEIIQAQWLTFDEIERLNRQGKIRDYSTWASIEKVENENSRD